MAKYSLEIKHSAQKELDAFDDVVFSRVDRKILSLSENPRPPGCKKLKSHVGAWRVRVGDYRVVYTVDDSTRTVTITRVAHRREVYE